MIVFLNDRKATHDGFGGSIEAMNLLIQLLFIQLNKK